MSEWEGDFRKRDKILRQMCEYPYILEQRNKSICYDTQNMSTLDPFIKAAGQLPYISNNSQVDVLSRTGLVTNFAAVDRANKTTVIVRQADVLNENRIVLYKRGKLVGNGYYIVEISSNNT